MKAPDGNSKGDHKNHDYPSFYIEKGERTILFFFFLFDPSGVFIVEPFKNEYEE